MSASPVRVDRPAEAVAVAGDVVEGGAGADLVEVDPHRLGGVEGADHAAVADAREAEGVLEPLLVPPHSLFRSDTNICSHRFATMADGVPREDSNCGGLMHAKGRQG